MKHTLVVGGTGMLQAVSLYFAEQGHTTSVIARKKSGINRLARSAQALKGSIHSLPLDYHDDNLLAKKLEDAIQQHGPVQLVVSWIHSSAKKAPQIIAKAVNRSRKTCRYFELLGSAARDPAKRAAERKQLFDALEYVQYRSIILGFVKDQSAARWLTHREISRGVIEAVEEDREHTIVGTVHPWAERP